MLLDRIALSADERVVTIVRKHWFILCAEMIGLTVAWVAPFILSATMPLWRTDAIAPLLNVFDAQALAFAGALWTLILASAFFHRLTDYYLDIWIITNERIIAIDQHGLFYRSIASVRLNRIQNLDIEIDGFIATMLDFGTIRVESAAHDMDFVIYGIPRPREMKALILQEAPNTPQ